MSRQIVIQIPTFKEACTGIKNHVIEHKDIYIVGGTCIAVGIVIGRSTSNDTYITNNNTHNHITMDTNNGAAVVDHQENYNEITTINHVTLGGYQTKIVECVETGELFPSVNDAADNAGVSASVMSRHINGHQDHIYGDHYRIVALSTADPRF